MAVTDTSDIPENEDGAKRKGSGILPIILGLLLAAALGGAGFFAAYSGLIPLAAPGEAVEEPNVDSPPADKDATAFVAVPPMVVTLGSPGRGRHLKFRAQLEVAPGRSAEVEALMPRILDTMNGYLRAVPLEELEAASALIRLRSQLLRRVQLVTAQGAVRDLLIMEFVVD